MTRAVGIDLGTTISSIGCADESGRVTLFALRDGSPRLRSVVTIDAGGEITVGEEAQRLAPLTPDSSFAFFKRRMGTSWQVGAGGRTWTPAKLSAEILKALAADAEVECGERPRQAVVTIPAYFGDDARRATQQAASLAGLEILALLHESTAACLAHRPDRERTTTILVYDLGGGTFDVSVVRFGRDGDEVLATAGDDRLGGKDWDDVLVVAERVFETLGADVRDDLSVIAELQERARDAKHALSRMSRTAVTLHAGGRVHRVEITQEEFESLAAPLFGRTEELVERVLADVGGRAILYEVLLVGGSSRMPLCRSALERTTGMQPRTGVDPDAVVAHGAAIAACEASTQPRPGGSGLGIARRVRDVTAHALGFVVLSTDGSRYVNDVMIRRNAPIPATESKRHRLAVPRDGTGLLDIHMLQGEAQRPLDTNPLGRWTFERVPGDRRGHVDVDVSYAYDEHGVVHVSAAIDGRELEPPAIDRDARDLRWTDEDPASHAAPEIAVALVIDVSQSMSGSKLREAKKACCGFVDVLEEAGAGDRVALVAFGSSSRLLAPLGTSPDEVRRSASGLRIDGSTNLADGLGAGWHALGEASGRRVLVVLTDGEPDDREGALSERQSIVRGEGEIIARGVRGADQAFLRKLATGGGELLGAGELVSSFRGIAQQLAAGGSTGLGRVR